MKKRDRSNQLLGNLDSVYREAPIGLCQFDTDLRYVHINEWLASINGFSIEERLASTG